MMSTQEIINDATALMAEAKAGGANEENQAKAVRAVNAYLAAIRMYECDLVCAVSCIESCVRRADDCLRVASYMGAGFGFDVVARAFDFATSGVVLARTHAKYNDARSDAMTMRRAVFEICDVYDIDAPDEETLGATLDMVCACVYVLLFSLQT